MTYEMLKALKEANQQPSRRIYTVPRPAEPWNVSQIEGMALFNLALQVTYDWYKANKLR